MGKHIFQEGDGAHACHWIREDSYGWPLRGCAADLPPEILEPIHLIYASGW